MISVLTADTHKNFTPDLYKEAHPAKAGGPGGTLALRCDHAGHHMYGDSECCSAALPSPSCGAVPCAALHFAPPSTLQVTARHVRFPRPFHDAVRRAGQRAE